MANENAPVMQRRKFFPQLAAYLSAFTGGSALCGFGYKAGEGAGRRRGCEEGYAKGRREALGEPDPVINIKITVDSDNRLMHVVAEHISGNDDFFAPSTNHPPANGMGFIEYEFAVGRSAPPSPDDRRSQPEEKPRGGYPIRIA